MQYRRQYNQTNTCDKIKDGKRCEEKLIPTKSYKEYNENGIWTGKWICNKCYMRDLNNKPDSYNNIIKKLRDRRTKNQDPNSTNAKGDSAEELTCRWRDVKNLNIECDNYKSSLDHSEDPELGVIQTKSKFYDNRYRTWQGGWKNEHNKDFDNLIYYCISKDGNHIERIYIFPREEVLKRVSICVFKDPSKGFWHEKYRIKDEEIIKKVDSIWQNIKNNHKI